MRMYSCSLRYTRITLYSTRHNQRAEGWPAESQSSDSVSKLSLDAPTSVGPPTEFEPPARLGEAPARQAVLKRHTQARANKAWQFYSAQTTDVAVVMAGANPSTSSTERSRSRL